MAIDRDGKGSDRHVAITCDTSGCDAVFRGDPGEEFTDVWTRAKQANWRTKKIAGEWLHGCPSCGVPT